MALCLVPSLSRVWSCRLQSESSTSSVSFARHPPFHHLPSLPLLQLLAAARDSPRRPDQIRRGADDVQRHRSGWVTSHRAMCCWFAAVACAADNGTPRNIASIAITSIHVVINPLSSPALSYTLIVSSRALSCTSCISCRVSPHDGAH